MKRFLLIVIILLVSGCSQTSGLDYAHLSYEKTELKLDIPPIENVVVNMYQVYEDKLNYAIYNGGELFEFHEFDLRTRKDTVIGHNYSDSVLIVDQIDDLTVIATPIDDSSTISIQFTLVKNWGQPGEKVIDEYETSTAARSNYVSIDGQLYYMEYKHSTNKFTLLRHDDEEATIINEFENEDLSEPYAINLLTNGSHMVAGPIGNERSFFLIDDAFQISLWDSFADRIIPFGDRFLMVDSHDMDLYGRMMSRYYWVKDGRVIGQPKFESEFEFYDYQHLDENTVIVNGRSEVTLLHLDDNGNFFVSPLEGLAENKEVTQIIRIDERSFILWLGRPTTYEFIEVTLK